MRHRVAHRKLGRVTEHRISMLRNQAVGAARHERIQTTVPRAKELRPFVERIITIAKRSLNAPEGSTARRHGETGGRRVTSPIATVVTKLFDDDRAALRRAARRLHAPASPRPSPGRQRRVAEVELLGSEYDPNAAAKAEKGAGEAPTSPRRRRWAAGFAKRWAAARSRPGPDGGKAKVDKAAKGAGKKITTPRKAGGS